MRTGSSGSSDLNLTTVYVTHDQSEALALSHEIAVMNGVLWCRSAPRRSTRRREPVRRQFVGTTNCRWAVTVVDGGRARQLAGGRSQAQASEAAANGAVIISVRPETSNYDLAGRGRRREHHQGDRQAKDFANT
jgi:iron(III) transport system ATP-binding protein